MELTVSMGTFLSKYEEQARKDSWRKAESTTLSVSSAELLVDSDHACRRQHAGF